MQPAPQWQLPLPTPENFKLYLQVWTQVTCALHGSVNLNVQVTPILNSLPKCSAVEEQTVQSSLTL